MNKFILIATLLTFAGFAAKAATDKPTTGNPPPPPDPDNNINPDSKFAPDYVMFTDHDNTYNYKRENGVWFTQRKGTSKWINMQVTLDPEDYATVVNMMNAHLAKKGLKGLGCMDKPNCNCNLGFLPQLIAATTVSHVFREGVLTHDNRPQKVESNLVMV